MRENPYKDDQLHLIQFLAAERRQSVGIKNSDYSHSHTAMIE